MGQYRELLRVPGAARLVAAAFVGRLPFAIESLALILLIRDATGSYATAGAVSAASGLGAMVGVPVLGRLMDRRGQSAVVVATGLGHAALLALLVAIAPTAGAVVLVACAGAAGLLLPPLGIALRAVLPRLLEGRPALLETAFALDAITVEVFFIAGPLITAGLSAAIAPSVPLLLAGLLAAGGAAAYASAPLARTVRGGARATGRFGPLTAAGLRTLLLVAAPQGITLGALEVGLPAFADERGPVEVGGVLLATWAAGSLAGGLLYGARRHSAPLSTRFLALCGLFALGTAPAALVGGLGLMGVVCVLAGLALAPVTIVSFTLVSQVCPPGTAAEANAWLLTATVAGISVGTALAGRLADGPGPSAAFAFGTGAAAVAALVALVRRRTLAPLPSPVP